MIFLTQATTPSSSSASIWCRLSHVVSHPTYGLSGVSLRYAHAVPAGRRNAVADSECNPNPDSHRDSVAGVSNRNCDPYADAYSDRHRRARADTDTICGHFTYCGADFYLFDGRPHSVWPELFEGRVSLR